MNKFPLKNYYPLNSLKMYNKKLHSCIQIPFMILPSGGCVLLTCTLKLQS